MWTWFNDTSLGKSLKVLVWIAISGAIAYLAKFFTDNPAYFSPYTVGIINIVLVLLKNLVDPKMKNV